MKTKIYLAFAMTLLALPALAEAPDGNLRVMLASANPMGNFSGDFSVGGMTVPVEIEADSGAAFGIVYEVRFGERWGMESGVYFAEFDFQLASSGLSTDFGSALAIPLTFGADFHIISGKHVDLYVGPQLSYTFWGNLDTTLGPAEIDGDFGFGAVAGLDIRPGGGDWTLNFATRYLGIALADPSLEVAVDPLLVEVGVGYRF